jgi:hypothetical protein
VNECAACGLDFGSVKAFDAHRVGRFPQTGASEYAGPPESWTRRKGRRCLTATEMETGGAFARNARGCWSLADSLVEARGLREAEIGTLERAA